VERFPFGHGPHALLICLSGYLSMVGLLPARGLAYGPPLMQMVKRDVSGTILFPVLFHRRRVHGVDNRSWQRRHLVDTKVHARQLDVLGAQPHGRLGKPLTRPPSNHHPELTASGRPHGLVSAGCSVADGR